MPESSGPPSSIPADLEWVWAGYSYFIERELQRLEPPGQSAAYAAQWGLPEGIRPIAGGDIFGDINRIATAVANFIDQAIDWVRDALMAVVRLPGPIFSSIATMQRQTSKVRWMRGSSKGTRPGWPE